MVVLHFIAQILQGWDMKKFLQVAFLVAFLGNITNAEQSGGFLGLEVGYGSLVVPFDYKLTANNMTYEMAGNFKGDGAAFGFLGGYKQFFNSYFGLRYFANINVITAKVSPKVTKDVGNYLVLDKGDNRSATVVNYGLNVDMLVNFIAREKNKVADFGAFLGFGLGGASWSGQAVNDIDYYISRREEVLAQLGQNQKTGWKATRNFFDFSLNVGLRTNIMVNHGAELAFRVPLVKNAFLNKQDFKVNTKNQTSITLRYTYSFGTAKKIIRKVIKRKVKKQANSQSTVKKTGESTKQNNIK